MAMIDRALLGLSHHILQRRAVRLARESRYLVQYKLNQWCEKLPPEEEFRKEMDEFLNVFSGITDLLEVNVEGLARVDGAGAAQRNALQRITDAFNAELNKLQNPEDCSKAKHLVVDFNKGCGFGCQIHHASHCFRLAIASGRVLHLRSDKLTYSEQGFVSVFQPLTKCPLLEEESEVVDVLWGSPGFETATYVFCPIVEELKPVPEYAHPAVPASIAEPLNHLHGAPSVWVSGHLSAYLMRLQNGEIATSMDKLLKSIRDPTDPAPVVGVHVRRTDKINTEAKYHKFEEYMYYVDQYYNRLDAERTISAQTEGWRGDDAFVPMKPYKRRVFIATDDPNVFKEARDQFGSKLDPDGQPLYEFIGDAHRAESASLSTRYTHGSLLAVVADVIALSHTDYLVCTFSSQIGRLAYELMQTYPLELGDASMRCQSLDDSYYYGGQQQWYQTAIVDDKASNIKAGDRVGVLGNHWNGYAKVILPKSLKEAILPAYKFESSFKRIDFPGFRVNASSLA
nr:alpha (1,6) fucosyltransferase [Hymenolepis microstoma]